MPAAKPSPRLKEDAMYARVLAGDAASNGRFFFGVTTTGIYCLPSCRARKPLRKNTRFFPTVEAARAGGLRPCRKCRPDDFASGADPVLESIEALVAEMRADPAAFPDVRAVARRSGFGPTRLFELFRLHYHATPADVLLRARLGAARARLRESGAGLAAIAAETGFESLSAFHDQFRRHAGLTPAAYRALAEASGSFTLALPPGYPLSYLRRALGRDPQSLSERLEGDVYTAGARLASGPVRVVLRLSPEAVKAEWSGPGASAGAAYEIQERVAGMLGFDQDAAAFARLARRLGFARLVAGRPELRVVQSLTVFDGLLWAILGQQINMPFAFLLRARLIRLAGEPLDDGLYAPPAPAAVAALAAEDLLPLQFSRQKAQYVIRAARLVADGALALENLRASSATRAERTLLAVHGLGPWSVNYLMMRSLGFADCVPYGDTGVTRGLQTLMHLEERPDIPATRRLMAAFAPWRSLATAHLWQLHQPEPS
jgi:AraC family transcriptional regulator of adaptative response / DNA-3-methyladenine glycosylase II